MPTTWYAGNADGLWAIGPDGEATLLWEDISATPHHVHLGSDWLVFAWSDEPVHGRWGVYDLASGAFAASGFGVPVGAHPSGVWLSVGPAHSVILQDLEGGELRRVSSTSQLGITDAALAPDLARVAVSADEPDGGSESIYVFDPYAVDRIEDGVKVDLGAPRAPYPRSPAIDALGRVWYVRGGDGTWEGVVVDPTTGTAVDTFEYPREVVTQQFDASGTWLIIAYTDGTVRWRSLDGATGDLASRVTDIRGVDW